MFRAPTTTVMMMLLVLMMMLSSSSLALQTRTQESLGLEVEKHADILLADDEDGSSVSALQEFLASNPEIASSGRFDYGLYEVLNVVSIQAVCNTERSECICQAQLLSSSAEDENNGVCHTCVVINKEQSNAAFGAAVDCTDIDPRHPSCQFQCTVPNLEYHPEQVALCGLNKCYDADDGFAATDGGNSLLANQQQQQGGAGGSFGDEEDTTTSDQVDVLFVEKTKDYHLAETINGPKLVTTKEEEEEAAKYNDAAATHQTLAATLSAKMTAVPNMKLNLGRALLEERDFPKLVSFLDINTEIQETGIFDLGHYKLLEQPDDDRRPSLLEVHSVCNTNRTTCICQARFKNQPCPLCGVQNVDDANPALGADVDCSHIDQNFPDCAFSCENPDLQDELEAGTCGFNTCMDLTANLQPVFVPIPPPPQDDPSTPSGNVLKDESGAVSISRFISASWWWSMTAIMLWVTTQ